MRQDGVCDGDWVPAAGKEDCIRPADGAQILSSFVKGEAEVSKIDTRTHEGSTTIEVSIGFANVLSFGFSFSPSSSESIFNSEATLYHLDKGEEGCVIWTSFVRCSEGLFFSLAPEIATCFTKLQTELATVNRSRVRFSRLTWMQIVESLPGNSRLSCKAKIMGFDQARGSYYP